MPPGVWAETYTHSNGRTETVYKQRMSEEGPFTRVDGTRTRHLLYMYGHWVFVWSETAKTLNIGFGTVESHTVEHRDVPIDLAWGPDNLVTFGRQWRQALIKRVT